MQTAIVTGGAGFIGSHVADALLAEGHRVVVVDDLSTGNAANVPDQAELEVVDIVDAEALRAVFDAARPAAVYHLGAQSMVTVSVTDPAKDGQINVLGTLNVLEIAGVHRAPVVFTSTGGALYGNEAPRPTPETTRPPPSPPMGHPSGRPRRTSARGPMRPASATPCADWPTSMARGKALMVRRGSYRSSPTSSGRAEHQSCTGMAVPPATTSTSRMWPTRCCERPGPAGCSTSPPDARPRCSRSTSSLAQAAGARVTPELAPLREGELERSCMDPTLAERELGWKATVGLEEGVPSTYRELVAQFAAA